MIIKCFQKDEFPCDLLLIGSSEKKGTCEIETKGLDGETNTKVKLADKHIYPLASTEKDALRNLNGMVIECE
jgi:magnesium-transporting ATPase (P-type)